MSGENLILRGTWDAECVGPEGLKWRETWHNKITNSGLSQTISSALSPVAGSLVTFWYVGLKGTGTAAATDTLASHGGWSEIYPYSRTSRPGFTPAGTGIGQIDNSAAGAVFSINGTSTVFGAFLCSEFTQSLSTSTLFSAGDFASSRGVASGDTLTITATFTSLSST